jgi:redox-sensitive bicupin YhaK (pirin superfamily)
MITIRRSADRGHADHGWLQARHTFSFARYHDPEWMAFGPLRVLNQDIIQGGQGFGTHPHDNMEILTWVLSGALEHRDSLGNGSVMHPGEAQFMSAGTGVTHSEFNHDADEPCHLLQMWILPAARDTEPRYDQRAYDDARLDGRLHLVASGDADDEAIRIGQDVRFFAGRFGPGQTATLELAPGRGAWVHVALGSLTLDGESLGPGDGAAVTGAGSVTIADGQDAEVVVWDLPLA